MAASLKVVDNPPAVDDPVAEVRAAYDRLRLGYAAERYPTARVREDWLARLSKLLKRYSEDIATAINADFWRPVPSRVAAGRCLFHPGSRPLRP